MRREPDRDRGQQSGRDVAATAVLALSRNGIVFPLELPTVTVPRGAPETKLLEIRAAGADVNLVQHLADNRLHYSQAVYRELDAAMIAGLLAPFSITMNGTSRSRWCRSPSRRRCASWATHLHSRSIPTRLNDAEWRAFMDERGIVIGQSKVDMVPLSSGGIFAEAVLGRFNCAEKLDLSRFFNWQDRRSRSNPLKSPQSRPAPAPPSRISSPGNSARRWSALRRRPRCPIRAAWPGRSQRCRTRISSAT